LDKTDKKMNHKNNKKLVVGNWKMNPRTEKEALELAQSVVNQFSGVEHPSIGVGVAPPFVFLGKVADVLEGSDIGLGAQDMFWEDKGGYTGEISADELKFLGVSFVIIGHSERRKMGETDYQINKKVHQALNKGFQVVLCVGESENTRNKGIKAAKHFISNELRRDLEKIKPVLDENPENLVIAYEPLWAISAEKESKPASPEKVVEIISFIKKFLDVNGIASATRVLYGGSVSSKNAKSFLERNEIDGVLVGGASLDANEFVNIIIGYR